MNRYAGKDWHRIQKCLPFFKILWALLVTSKTKVSPIKRLSIPRLELCGAHVLAYLLQYVKEVLELPMSDVFAWTDSTIVLRSRVLKLTLDVMEPVKFVYQEFSTILAQVEACLNSRSLVPTCSPEDDGIEVLTPGHFLISQPLCALPDPSSSFRSTSLLHQWTCARMLYVISGRDGPANILRS